ncbi:hypothetical protein [Listeria monocytogenes]|uniref:hypothetical protein n=1 Tax=Listeria monocytogenes TaxID=1639 RepID=UPI0011EC999B|nr:hypothetical protein [Listeria monocytogenes]EAV9864487.1 hypothetical protein [Listeria monocytogenes]EJH4812342.1 hypothetical protein [Listeria monocytogenes]EJH4963472.1 hypothetical protein [Listeria monocytogenes]EJH5299555.1 hypothetical protein [Listeria monocytogenes]EKZ1064609.1 hypothetical protein [Listeria monocytogenes]
MNDLIVAIETEYVGVLAERKKLDEMYRDSKNTSERSYCLGLIEGADKTIRTIERLLMKAKK